MSKARQGKATHLLAVAWLRVFTLYAVDESRLLGVEAVQPRWVLVDEGVVLDGQIDMRKLAG